jgi:hypothetical protein
MELDMAIASTASRRDAATLFDVDTVLSCENGHDISAAPSWCCR